MKDDIVIRIPRCVLRELLETHDSASDAGPGFHDAPPFDDPPQNRPWSDKQKRFIYRLLQRLGHEDEAAKNYIKTALRLNGAPPSRNEASALIDRLQAEVEKGSDRGAP